MLDATRTRHEHDYEMEAYPLDVIPETGLALTSLFYNGKKVARRSNATDNTIFLGFSWAEYIGVGTILPLNYSVVVPAAVNSAAYSLVPLQQTSTGVSDMIVIPGAGYGSATKLTSVSNATNYSAVNDATKYSLSADSNYIAVAASYAGTSLFIGQRYAPTAFNLRLLYGDMYLPTAAQDLGRIGVIQRGVVYTNAYDTSVDWSLASDFSTANVLRAGANGRLTLNSTGAICRDTTVVSIPTATDPWLGVKIEL